MIVHRKRIFIDPAFRGGRGAPAWALVSALLFALPAQAHASIFQGDTLDAVANAISWVAIILAPIIGITIFWFVHIWPEKIAEKKKHPQTAAIQCLCLLSLVFGGLLWPLAWLWAFTKPVLHKAAYGTDVDESVGHGHGHENKAKAEDASAAAVESNKKGGKA